MKTDILHKELESIFELNPENMEPKSALGAYVPKMNFIFQQRIFSIKLDVKEGRLYHEKFSSYKRGQSQTWHYIMKGLYFFGIIDDYKYNEQLLISEGIKLEIVSRYNTFSEYLQSPEAKERMIENFKNGNKAEWYKNKVFTSIWTHFNGAYGSKDFIPTKNTHNIFTEYKFMYEALAMIFTNDTYEMNSTNVNRVKLIRKTEKQHKVNSELSSEVKIHKAMKNVVDNNMSVVIDDYIDEYISESFLDGETKEAFVKVRKRNRKLRNLALKNKGSVCEACGLNLELMYGQTAVPHVHHKVPLYTMDDQVELTVDDLVILCPSCHSAIHSRRDPYIKFEEFKNELENRFKN